MNYYVRFSNRRGGGGIECPVCRWRGAHFLALDIGHRVLPEIECPQCHTHDRHRLFTLVWSSLGVPNGGRILHCAPEPAIRALLETNDSRIVSTDVNVHVLKNKPRPGVNADGIRLPFREASFDLLVSLHVLEHIFDDRAAIREYHRVLKPGGVALIMAPMLDWIPATDDWGRPDPEMFDHYRTYSTHDTAERFQPFSVKIFSPSTALTTELRARHAIRDDEHVLVCRKAI